MTRPPEVTIVVPTIGRASLARLLSALGVHHSLPPVILVDDRSERATPLPVPHHPPARVLTSGGRGPAAARNVGWRAANSRWIAFLDDDVVPDAGWAAALYADLRAADALDAAATQGIIRVPEPAGRPATDDERRTLSLAGARWITADMAYRRDALVRAGGFDERFPRAYREDSDLALRVTRAGGRVTIGTRRCTHPIAPARWSAALRAQAGNRDDALLRRKHGADWRPLIGEGPGRLPGHTVSVAAGLTALAAVAAGRPAAAAASGAAWLALTGRFAAERFRRGPRTVTELAKIAVTSALIPPLAVWHRMAGYRAFRRARPQPPLAVLLDRDDTLIADGPYLNDPGGVRPLPGASRALRRLRERGLLLAVVTNQSGVARGLISAEQLTAVNDRVERLLGPFDSWQVCVHDAGQGCPCRKPRPGMVLAAAAELGVEADRCVLIGDTGGDVEAALAARAGAVLVPTARTLNKEVADARVRAAVAATLDEAVSLVLRECR